MAALLARSTFRVLTGVERTVQTRCLSLTKIMGAERKYTKKHEWVSVDGSIGTVGISDFAAEALGDVVFVELPEVGTELAKGDSTGAVESVKAASDVYAPISGTVTETNEVLEEESGRINKSPFEEGWMYKLKVKDASELADLMSESEYEQFKKEDEGH